MLYDKIEVFRKNCNESNLPVDSPCFGDEFIIKSIE